MSRAMIRVCVGCNTPKGPGEMAAMEPHLCLECREAADAVEALGPGSSCAASTAPPDTVDPRGPKGAR